MLIVANEEERNGCEGERRNEVQQDATRVVHAWASTDVAARVWAPGASRAIDLDTAPRTRTRRRPATPRFLPTNCHDLSRQYCPL